jgi:cytochrome c biogenesis factor
MSSSSSSQAPKFAKDMERFMGMTRNQLMVAGLVCIYAAPLIILAFRFTITVFDLFTWNSISLRSHQYFFDVKLIIAILLVVSIGFSRVCIHRWRNFHFIPHFISLPVRNHYFLLTYNIKIRIPISYTWDWNVVSIEMEDATGGHQSFNSEMYWLMAADGYYDSH